MVAAKPSAFGLTPRQMDLWSYLASYMAGSGGIAPTVQELGDGVGIKSKSITWWLLQALEERGYIRRLKGRQRAIEILVPAPVSSAPDGAPLYFVPVPVGSHHGAAPVPTLSAGAVSFHRVHDTPNSRGGQHDHG